MQAPGFEPGLLAFLVPLEGQGPTRLDYACQACENPAAL